MNVLVVGGASCVWDDLESVPEGWWDQVVAVNDVGVWWDLPLDHWVSLHAEKFSPFGHKGDWLAQRRAHGYPDAARVWSAKGRLRRGELWPGTTDALDESWSASGSSGLFAVRVALHVGASRVILCGVPIDRRPHFTESRNHSRTKAFSSAEGYRKAWQRQAENLRPCVRSMSGWTRNLLGGPDEWLNATK